MHCIFLTENETEIWSHTLLYEKKTLTSPNLAEKDVFSSCHLRAKKKIWVYIWHASCILLGSAMSVATCFVRKRTFFLEVGRAGASEGRIISESEHQKGSVIPLCKLLKGRITHLFQNFCDVAFHFSNRLSFSFPLLWFSLVFYYRFLVTFL